MRSRLAAPLVLVACAVAVGLYTFVWDRPPPADSTRSEGERRLVPNLHPAEITTIAIRRGAERLSLVCSETDGAARSGDFVVDEPGSPPADVATIQDLFRMLGSARYLRKVTLPASSLESASVELTSGTSHLSIVVFGDALQPAHARYLQVDGVGYVVAGDVAEQLMRPLDEYRDPHLLVGAEDELVAIRIEAHGDSLRLKWDARGWLLPSGHRAASARVRALVGEALELQAAPRERPSATLGPLEGGLTFEWEGRGSETLRFHAGCGDLPSHDAGAKVATVVREGGASSASRSCVELPAAAALFPKSPELEERHMIVAPIDEVSEFIVEEGGGKSRLELARVDALWRQRVPREQLLTRPESQAATAYLERLLDEEGELVSFADATAETVATLVVTSGPSGAPREERVRIVKRHERFVGIRALDGVALRLPADVADLLEARDFTALGDAAAK